MNDSTEKRAPMKTCVHSKTKPTLARSVAGEDLQIGEFISVLSVISEMPSFMWDSCDLSLRPEELIRLKYIPERAGHPLKIIGICLPFVYVRSSNKAVEILDLRLTQVVRLDRHCAKEIWRLARKRSAAANNLET